MQESVNKQNCSTDISNNVSACKKIFNLQVDAQIFAAAMKECSCHERVQRQAYSEEEVIPKDLQIVINRDYQEV